MPLLDKVPVFIAEIAPKNLRGSLTAANQVNIFKSCNSLKSQYEQVADIVFLFLQFMICGGVSVSFIIGNVLTWRTLALVGKISYSKYV